MSIMLSLRTLEVVTLLVLSRGMVTEEPTGRQLSPEHFHTDNLTLGFQVLDLGENQFALLKLHSLWSYVTTAPVSIKEITWPSSIVDRKTKETI